MNIPHLNFCLMEAEFHRGQMWSRGEDDGITPIWVHKPFPGCSGLDECKTDKHSDAYFGGKYFKQVVSF